MRLRPVVLVGLVVAALVAVGCSSEAADAPVTAATIVTAPPATTGSSVATTLVATTVATTVAVSTTAATSTSSTSSTPSSVPATTTTVTTVPATTATATTAAPSTTAAAGPANYATTTGPSVGGQTTAIDPGWLGADGATLTTVADGTYWATLAGEGETPQRFVNFKLTQAFFGAACTAKFGDDSCDNDFATLEKPTGTFPLYLGTARITVADAVTQQSFEVTGDELFGLVGGAGASAAAPPGFTYVPFAFLLTAAGGQIVSAEQVWTP